VLELPDGQFTAQLEAELEAYCRERLAPFKVPRFWASVEALPITGSGKIQKFAVRERLLHRSSD
jgi:fatty-acyl-CoA synthase